ncbi:uncharacterized protein [Battus philenor]|uniref:uncharacterized protein isoform X2 n=1 Tax=Battus philenor TaxID=42288 RepID=UPI0035CEDD4B
MQSSGQTALCLLCVTGLIFISEAVREVELNEGEILNLSIIASNSNENIEECFLETPNKKIIQFKPEDHSNDKYRLLPDSEFTKCQASVNNLQSGDNGVWTLRSVSDMGPRNESVKLTVISEETTESISIENIGKTEESTIEVSTKVEDFVITNQAADETTELITETTTIKIDDIIILDSENITTKYNEGHKLTIPEYDFSYKEKCYIVLPDGKRHDFEDMYIHGVRILKENNVACGVVINIDSDEMIGNWMLISRSVRFGTEIVERRLPVRITLEEDTIETTTAENILIPELDQTTTRQQTEENTEKVQTTESLPEISSTTLEEVSVTYLEPGYFNTKIGEIHEIKIPEYVFYNTEECYIIAPDGQRHDLEHLDIYGMEVIKDFNVACGVKIEITSENMVGNWMLVARGTKYSTDVIERRLQFTIVILEKVNSLPTDITIMEGRDIYLRLEDSTPFYDTCKLTAPFEESRENIEKDIRFVDTCGFIVRNATKKDSGQWTISYGLKTNYRAWTAVYVYGKSDLPLPSNYVWTINRPITQLIGPDNTVYCKVIDANSNVVFDGFGKCNVTLARVTAEHAGTWTIFLGLEGRVLMDENNFTVSVQQPDSKPAVSTSVKVNKPTVTLTCSVFASHPVRSCKFRDPGGRILLAIPGVGEDRYTFHGNGSSHECGIQIMNPVIGDLGLWRCGIETETENYYGFLKARCPWAIKHSEEAANIQFDPVLKADSQTVKALVGESVTMSCSVQSPITYCYFRARNGTTYSVSPGQSSGAIEYAGAGFDAGECSIRFSNLLANDSGLWSCHVGFPNKRHAEQNATYQVSVQDTLVTEQIFRDNVLFVRGRVHDNRGVEYCRFVRIDGLGFTTNNLPDGYSSESRLLEGICEIVIVSPSVLERHPWTIAVRVTGMDYEYAQQTSHSLTMPGPEDTGVIFRFPLTWIFIIVIGLSLIIVGILVGPKRNRTWTYARASLLRNNFRRSFNRKTASEQNVPAKNTPMSA